MIKDEKDLDKINFWVIIALILIGFSLYFISLKGNFFHFDDKISIADNQAIKELNLQTIFDAFNTRFLVGLSFALNYKLFGLYPASYRFINIFIHILNSYLVYLLVRTTFQLNSTWKQIPLDRIKWASIFASILFLCHPIETEAVNFITQRFVLMGSFFYILTLLSFIEYRRQSKMEYYIGGLVCALAAMFCKEFVITLPIMLTVYEFYFINTLKESFPRKCSVLIPFFVIVLVVPLMLLRTTSDTTGVAKIADIHFMQKSVNNSQKVQAVVDISRAGNGIGRRQYFLTELNVVRTYVRLMFLPINQNIDYDYPISHRLDQRTILSGSFLIILFGIAVLTFKEYRVVSFGILWFFIALIVESSVIPIGHVIAEYRLYLPSIGFILVATSLLYQANIDIKLINITAAAILCSFSILTIDRNYVWADEIRLWQDTLQKSPLKLRPYINLSGAYVVNNRYTEAISIATKGIELNPNERTLYYNACESYLALKNYQKALAYCSQAESMDPKNIFYKQMIGEIYFEEGIPDKGIWYFKDAFLINPDEDDAEAYARAVLYYYSIKKDKDGALRYALFLEKTKYSSLADLLKKSLNQSN